MTERATPGGRIVVGVDGSESSKDALRWAHRLAAATGSSIEAVIVWDYPTNYGWAVAVDDWRPDTDAETVLKETIDEVFEGHPPTSLVPIVRQGQARQVLLEESRGADMLVVGSRGHGGFAGLLLGSVSAACAEHAHCPVLVVHGEGSGGQRAGR